MISDEYSDALLYLGTGYIAVAFVTSLFVSWALITLGYLHIFGIGIIFLISMLGGLLTPLILTALLRAGLVI